MPARYMWDRCYWAVFSYYYLLSLGQGVELLGTLHHNDRFLEEVKCGLSCQAGATQLVGLFLTEVNFYKLYIYLKRFPSHIL